VTAMPATACAQLPFRGQNNPSKHLGGKSEIAHQNLIIPEIFTAPPA